MASHIDTALALLAQIESGNLDLRPFTPEARWWWNGGLDLPVEEFDKLLGTLHAQTVSGIKIEPGRIIADHASVMVEATTRSPLRDGRLYDNRYVFLIHFQGDEIAGVREYSDSAHVLKTFDLPGAA